MAATSAATAAGATSGLLARPSWTWPPSSSHTPILNPQPRHGLAAEQAYSNGSASIITAA